MLTDPREDYARGYIPFLDSRIYLDSHPLIPRPETEYWAERAIAHIAKIPNASVLDLFAGSGAIGVAVLTHVPDAHVDFGEIEKTHLPTIEKNIHENGIESNRARVIETDVWSNISKTYDAVLANPPYLSEARMERVQPEVLALEPHTALFAKEEGLALIRRMVEGLPAHLTKNGAAYIEHEPEQAETIATYAAKVGFKSVPQTDQYDVVRFSVLTPADMA